MLTNCTVDGGSPFRIKRPLVTTSGFVSGVDATIKTHLDELNQKLGKRIFRHEKYREPVVEDGADNMKIREEWHAEPTIEKSRVVPNIEHLLARPLTPKRIPSNTWPDDSIVHEFNKYAESQQNITLSDYIDLTPDLSALKYAFQGHISANWFNLDFNTKAVLDGYPAISDYLIAYAFHVMGLQDVNGLKNFILNNRSGAKNVINYAVVSAARTIIDKEQLKVPHYDDDNGTIIHEIQDAVQAGSLSLSSASFKAALQTLIDNHIFSGKESKLIDGANIGTLPPGIKPLLIKYIKHSPVPITAANIQFFLPLFISQIQGTTQIADPTEVDTAESDKDFDVEFLQDDNSLIQISVSAVKCASQLFYGMILGDELDVFSIVNYLTHKYLIRGGIEIQDSSLRNDLWDPLESTCRHASLSIL